MRSMMTQELHREAPAAPGETIPAAVAVQIFEARIAAGSYLSTAILGALVDRGVLQREDVASILRGMRQAVSEQLAGQPGDCSRYAAEFEHIMARIAVAFDLSRPAN